MIEETEFRRQFCLHYFEKVIFNFIFITYSIKKFDPKALGESSVIGVMKMIKEIAIFFDAAGNAYFKLSGELKTPSVFELNGDKRHVRNVSSEEESDPPSDERQSDFERQEPSLKPAEYLIFLYFLRFFAVF